MMALVRESDRGLDTCTGQCTKCRAKRPRKPGARPKPSRKSGCHGSEHRDDHLVPPADAHRLAGEHQRDRARGVGEAVLGVVLSGELVAEAFGEGVGWRVAAPVRLMQCVEQDFFFFLVRNGHCGIACLIAFLPPLIANFAMGPSFYLPEKFSTAAD